MLFDELSELRMQIESGQGAAISTTEYHKINSLIASWKRDYQLNDLCSDRLHNYFFESVQPGGISLRLVDSGERVLNLFRYYRSE